MPGQDHCLLPPSEKSGREKDFPFESLGCLLSGPSGGDSRGGAGSNRAALVPLQVQQSGFH